MAVGAFDFVDSRQNEDVELYVDRGRAIPHCVEDLRFAGIFAPSERTLVRVRLRGWMLPSTGSLRLLCFYVICLDGDSSDLHHAT